MVSGNGNAAVVDIREAWEMKEVKSDFVGLRIVSLMT
jgi:hypothetical protein